MKEIHKLGCHAGRKYSYDVYGAPAVVKIGLVKSSRVGYERIGLLWGKQGMGAEFLKLLSSGM
jgi:hypothetical protein